MTCVTMCCFAFCVFGDIGLLHNKAAVSVSHGGRTWVALTQGKHTIPVPTLLLRAQVIDIRRYKVRTMEIFILFIISERKS